MNSASSTVLHLAVGVAAAAPIGAARQQEVPLQRLQVVLLRRWPRSRSHSPPPLPPPQQLGQTLSAPQTARLASTPSPLQV